MLTLVVGPMLLGALIVLALADTPWGNERVRRVLVSKGNERLAGHLTIGSLRGGLLSHATLTDVQLADSARRPLFSARRVQLRYGLWPALRGHVVITALELDTPLVVLDKRTGGRWNFQSLLRASTTPVDTSAHRAPPELANVVIHHGTLVYRRPWTPDTTLAVDARRTAIAAALAPDARRRTERVGAGFQRVLQYRNIDARLPAVRLAHAGHPLAVEIASLAMLAEPYRPPAIDVRSLTGTLYASRDSLWWRDAHMSLPASRVSGDGRIGFGKSGLMLDLTGSPVSLADLRWLRPSLPAEGGGHLRLTIRLAGDTSTLRLADADVRYRDARLAGSAIVSQVKRKGQRASTVVRSADVTVAHLATSLIHELAPDVRLPRRGTLDGHLAVSGAAAALQLNADLRFADATAGSSHVRARGGIGMTGGFRASELRMELLPLRVATVSGGTHVPIDGTLTGAATVSGSMATGWRVRGDVTHVGGRGERSRVSGAGQYRTAGKVIVADATLQPVSLATIGRFVPAAELRGGVSGRVHAEGTTNDLRVSGVLRSTTGGGAIDGRGAVRLAGRRTRYDVSVQLDALDARAFSRRAPSTRLTGAVAARGVGTAPGSANATFAANLTRSRYDTFSVERLRTHGALSSGLLRLDTLDLLAREVRLSAAGTLGLVRNRTGSMGFAASVDSLGALRKWLGTRDTSVAAAPAARQHAVLVRAQADSARRADASRIERLALGLPPDERLVVDTVPGIRRDSLAGSVRAAGTLRGSLANLGLDARVEARDLVARGSAMKRLSASVTARDVRGPARSVVFRAEADTVLGVGREFAHVSANGRYRDRTLGVDLRVRQDALVSYAALGQWSHPAAGVHDVRLDSLRGQFDTLVWRLARPARVRLAGGDATLDSVDLRSSVGGRLFADGVLPATRPVRLTVVAENVRVATVLHAMQKNAAGDGVLSSTVQVGGTRAQPAMTGIITLRDARYGAARAPDADVALRYADHRLGLDGTARDSTGRRMVAATASLPVDLALRRVAGSRKLAGPLAGRAVLDSLSLAALPLPMSAVQDVRGMLAGDATLSGTWAAPRYTGRAAVRGGAAVVASTGMRVRDGVADLRLDDDALHVDSVVVHAGGVARVTGTVDVRDHARPVVRLAATAMNLRVMDATRGLLDVDGDLTAVGPLDAVRVTGRTEVLHGFVALKQFNKKLLRVKAPGSLTFFTVFDTARPPMDVARAAAEAERTRRLAVVADVSVVVDRGTFFRNRPDANTEFYTMPGEAVRAHVDTRTGDAWGTGFVRIGEGVAIFRAAPFEPARGTLTFLPWTGSPGMLEQVGERPVWEPGRGVFPVQLLTGGTSKAPALGLESGTVFPMRGRELNGYLTIGREPLSLLQQSGSSLSGSEAWSGQLSGETGALARRQQAATALGVALHDIGTGATKEFGLDAFSVSPADVPTELVFGKTGGVRGALIEGGRYVTPDRYLSAEMRLTTGIPGVRIQQRIGPRYRLEAGVAPRFLFRDPEELGITHPTVRTGVFGAFLSRYWDW